MKSRSPPAEISSAALEKNQSLKGRLVPTRVSFTRCLKQAPVTRRCSCLPLAAGVCEEATPQGPSEQPRPDAELLSQPAVRTFRTSQSHQRAAVSGGSQRKHERHQDPECKGEARGLFWDINRAVSLIPPCFYRKPW